MTAASGPGHREPAPRVAIVGPAPDAAGGIGRVMSYTLAALPPTHRVRVLDTRGRSAHPAFSLLPLLRAALTLLVLGATRRIDVAHVNISSRGSTIRKAAIVAVCHLTRVPTVLHLHSGGFPQFYESLSPLGKRAVRWVFRTPTTVVVLGNGWRDYVHDVLRVPPGRVTVLPNAVPGPSRVQLRRRDPTEALNVLFLGRLCAEKGVAELLAALADARLSGPGWRATLAGDGDVDRYRARAAELGLGPRTEFPGWVGADGTHRLMAQAHVLVLPSYAEGLPLCVLEAFAYGVPVITTPVGSLPDVVTHGVNGLLVAPRRVAGLADALAGLLGDERRRLTLAAGARRSWERSYAIDPYVAELTRQWRRAAARDGGHRSPGKPLTKVR
ncbi:MAG TPA: glycosyltransferase family 4 protein [Catenuloplanes sp.]|jgi:glycosyltransferase involved in cell wall biosynthesis